MRVIWQRPWWVPCDKLARAIRAILLTWYSLVDRWVFMVTQLIQLVNLAYGV